MTSDLPALVLAWWELALAANVVVSGVLLAMVVHLWAAGRGWPNKLAGAVAALLLGLSLGHGLRALKAVLALVNGRRAELAYLSDWRLASWDAVTAVLVVYCLIVARRHRSWLAATPSGSRSERTQPVELEELAAVNAARGQAEKQRDAQAAMLHSVIENSHSLVYVKDLEGRYLLANGQFEQRFGLEKGEILGHTDTYIDATAAPTWRANDVLAQAGPYELEESYDGPDGRRYFESTKLPLHDAEGVLYAICGISLDVTDKRQAAAAHATERDAALAATAAKTAFLATMSHEIRTPMNAVIGMTDLLLGTSLDESQREFVETIKSSGDALLTLINDILDFTKIESGELELESAPFDLRAEAEASLDFVLATASRKGLELSCDVDQDCPAFVIGDVHRFRQVLTNLLSNAVKFTDVGEVLLTVHIDRVGDGNARVLVSVADSGIGVAPERADRLFKSFSQLDASTTRVYGGTGLGLAISRRLAEAMGGELRLASTSPSGSTFVLDLVLPASAVSVAVAEEEAGGVPCLVGKTALLVDDNPTNLRILELQLTGLGMTCIAFSSPKAALAEVADDLPYDVAVLDMHMPELDGAHLGRALRALPNGGNAPLVLLTSLGWKPDGLKESFAAFLTKPTKRSVLQQTLVQVLRVSGQDHEDLASPHDDDASASPPLRVLLAEDNVTNQRVAQLMLDKLGHHVDTVANGVEAVTAVMSRPYDVVLMDIQMPHMDGLEATRRICSQVSREELPHIVAMTANALREDRDACAAAGMRSYLSKPVRLQELQAVLTQSTAGPSPQNSAGSEGAVDHEVLHDLLQQLGDGDSTVEEELIGQYVREADAQVVLLMDLVATGDWLRTKAIAHTWRSTSALFGAGHLADLLQQLECRAAEPGGDCGPLAQEIEREFGQVRGSLSDLVPTVKM